MIHRRQFIGASLLTLFSMAGGYPVIAQKPAAKIAWLSPSSEEDSYIFYEEFRTGLRERGLLVASSAIVRPYWSISDPARLATVLPEIQGWKPDVLVTLGSSSVAVRQANLPIPTAFGYSGDPVLAGLVESIARPGGHMTGISYMTMELVGKRMEILKEILPQAKHVAVIANSQHPGDLSERNASERAAKSVGLEITYYEARTAPQQMDALAKIQSTATDAVMLFPIQTVIANRRAIAEWSIKTKIPTISGWAQFVEGGNLISYGPNLLATSRRLASFVENILKGASAADLPVELPTRVELAINMRTARALEVGIPPTVLIRADRVIE